MAQVKRTLTIITEQRINHNKPEPTPGFPLRNWTVELFIQHTETGELLPAICFEKAVFNLHESFGKRQKQTKTKAPFKVDEEGWGEFDMQIHLTQVGKGELETIYHDLNFREERYESRHEVTFKNPKPELAAILRNSGPVADANGAGGKPDTGKRKRANKNVDMEKLADNLQKLDEESLLHVVQLVHDHKSAETYTKNDVENGEFHVDLYTLPDNLVKMLWDFAESKSVM